MFSYIYHRPRLLIRAYKYLFGYDKNEIRYTRESLSAGDVAFDIGAHKGAYAYWMRRSVKEKGKVLCIEPQPILYNYLNKVFKIFGFSNMTLMDCAISDKDTKGQITVPGKPGSISQGARIDNFNLVKNKHKDDIHTIDVQVRSIDSIVKETGLKPNLIKIDVEGHELSVLKGMVYTLVNIRPKIIIECEERHIKGFSVHDVFNLLLEKDYLGYYFHEGQKKPLSGFDLDRDQTGHLREHQRPHPNYVANFIFEPK